MSGKAFRASLIAVVWVFTIALSATSSARRAHVVRRGQPHAETRPDGSATEIDAAE
jgi:hypothetical protein